MSVVYRLTQDNRKESKTKGKWYDEHCTQE